MTAPPDGYDQPAQDHPGWRLWVSSTGRWWALRQIALTPAQITAGCQPLIYAPDNMALAVLISMQNDLRVSCLAGLLPRSSGCGGLA